MASCLVATLSHWYSWQQREWDEVLAELKSSVQLDDLSSSVQLRLALYDFVNEQYSGFLTAAVREEALRLFTEIHVLSVDELTRLLTLDSDEEAQLVRRTPEPPLAQEVALLYNQWAFEAALFNASSVRFLIDCDAFSHDQLAPATGVGAVIKRLTYLARKIGIYYDMAYADTLPGMPLLLSLTLYGPQEVTGAAQQYGLRLARLCRILMGYSSTSSGTARKPRKAVLNHAIVEAAATVHFLHRSYTFKMDDALLRLLPSHKEKEDSSVGKEQIQLFDSSIEQLFAEAFAALATSKATDGWRLEREPEPLLLERSIFIPDFALTRTQRRIYVEILGFWTSAYRERKLQKLQQLKNRDDLVLAIPEEAKEAFSSILSAFPIVLYTRQLSATDVLTVLRTHYDDFAERMAQIDVVAIRTRVRQDGLLVERTCFDLLYCYRRSELQSAISHVVEKDILFTAGVGLYTNTWIERVRRTFLAWLQERKSVALVDAVQALRQQESMLQTCDDEVLEAIIGMESQIAIQRDSIFEATITYRGNENEAQERPEVREHAEVYLTPEKPAKLREKRNSIKKALKSLPIETTQKDLWE
jgi:predicted nuclease of restriction endonuclease-like RecB superfamily